MIAFPTKKRGRPFGSRNMTGPVAMHISGAASSAASIKRGGVPERTGIWVWIPREGWVRWCDIERQIERAHREWRHRKAMEGVFIEGREEIIERDVRHARSRGGPREAWLSEWRQRHAELCRLAGVVESEGSAAELQDDRAA